LTDTSKPSPGPLTRAALRWFRPVTTRWRDNDAYGHVNNVVYYEWFDTAVNAYLIDAGVLDVAGGAVIGLVVHTECDYFAPLAYPEPVDVGLAVERFGRSSVHYRLGVFAQDAPLAAAQGRFVHVYVERATRRPVALPQSLAEALSRVLIDA
jgi:acyl-CoA thioester hydrolase